MKLTKWTSILGLLLIAVGGLDLLFGNTDHPFLPSFLTAKLTQQSDAVLLAAGAVLIFFV